MYYPPPPIEYSHKLISTLITHVSSAPGQQSDKACWSIPLIPALEAETEGPLSLKSPWFTQQVPGSQGYVRRPYLKKKKVDR